MRPKSGALLSSAEDIKKRWVEHFNELLNQLTNDDWDILGLHPTLKELDAPITMAEVGTAFNNARARWDFTRDPCTWWQCSAILFTIFNLLWTTEDLPSDWIDASTCILFKKGDRSLCGNYRGVSMLCVIGKTFADFSPTATPVYLAEPVYSESQSSYRKNRGTVDGIFTLRQIMEKSREQEHTLHIAFIDFTKASDCVNRELLFANLEKLGCPAKLSRVVKKLYTNVHARLIIDEELSEPIKYVVLNRAASLLPLYLVYMQLFCSSLHSKTSAQQTASTFVSDMMVTYSIFDV